MAVGRDYLTSQRPKAPLHAVADDCSTNLFGDGETDAFGRIAILAVADEKHETGHCGAPAGVRSEKVGAFPKID